MEASLYDFSAESAKRLFYQDGRLNPASRQLAVLLLRGISGVVNSVVANDSEAFLERLVENAHIDFRIEAYADRSITFYGSVDGAKAAQVLAQNRIEVPDYVKEIVLSGGLAQARYPYSTGTIPKHRFPIFNVGEDINAGELVSGYISMLRLPLDYVLRHWDFNQFEHAPDIRRKLAQAGLQWNESDGKFLLPVYVTNLVTISEALRMISTEEAVRVLFGDESWRNLAIRYGNALLEAALHDISDEKERLQGEQRDFIEKMGLLFRHYKARLEELNIWRP